ncbi:MAG: hypothetical protein OXN25_17945 [Candidatus Poribacteria bacterium]|nr:hypothetical protein [Candidatus Poribacteria bacterium]
MWPGSVSGRSRGWWWLAACDGARRAGGWSWGWRWWLVACGGVGGVGGFGAVAGVDVDGGWCWCAGRCRCGVDLGGFGG